MDVNKGVAITIENIDGKGAITNAGSVTIEKGSIEGPITFEKGDATADNMVTVGKDGKTTLTGGVAGSGTIDKLAIAEDDETTITNAKLSGHDGRALWNNGTLTVNGGSFEGNKANVAGAIYNAAGAELTVDGVTFASNSSAIAGAINNRDGKVTITNSTFKGNDAGKSMGGAVRNDSGDIQKDGTITITGSTFEGNKAGNGGAVWNGSDGKVEIADSTFKGNTALAEGGLGQGGAITNANAMTITGGSFANNTAKYSGGAIYNGAHAANGQASLTIDGTTFTGNSVKADFNTTQNDNIAGGAIFNDTNAKLDVKNATFTDNTSSLKGGAIFNRDGNVTITDSTFKGNSVPKSAGGAVLNESGDINKDGTITITGSTFEGNKAGNGGAVWNGFDGTVTITNSTFKGNTALAGIGQGGAITNADQMTITGSTFEGNQAGKIGGAIFNAASGKLDFNGTNTFTNNTAAGKANDIYNAGTITVKDGTTTLNSGLILAAGSTTDVSGGALVINGNTTWEKGDNLGSLTVNGGALTLQKGDVLEGYDKAKENTSLSVNSGSLYLINKDNYTAKNFTAAKKVLNVNNASFGFVGGQLVDDGGNVTGLVVSGNTIGADTKFDTDGLTDTTVNNSSFLKNDLTVKADATDVTINGADVAVNKVNIGTSATGDKSLTINNNGSLTVVGGNANDKLIAANGTDDLTTINVYEGKLNLGSAAMPERGAGTLGKANITLGNDGSLNASNGDYTVGDVTGTGEVTADAGANLNTGGIEALTVTADAANIKATGDVTAGDIDLVKGGSVTSDKNITVNGSIEDADGTLQAGGNITVQNDITKAGNGKLTVAAGGTIEAANISATNVAAKKLTASGDVAVDGGVLNLTGTGTATADASTVDSLTLTNGTQADIAGSLQLATNSTLTVGTDDDTVGGTTLSAQHIDLNGGMLLVDPAWGLASSNVAVESLSAGSVGVGRNSYLALGTADTGWLPGVVGNYTKGVGLSETGITAALGVFKGIEIAGKNLTVDGSKTGTEINTGWTSSGATNSATFADNSLLVINGQNIYGDKAAISFKNPGTLSVAEGAKLLVTDAVAGQTYTIVGNVTNPATNLAGWKNNGMTSTTDMISLGDAKFDGTDKVTTSAVRNDAHTVFPNLSDGMANAVNDLYTGHAGAAGQPNWDYADVNSDQMGVRFLSRATDNRFLGMDKNAAAESIESAARIAFAGAAPQMTRMASDAGTNAVVNRLGFADPADGAQAMDAEGKIVDRNTTGFALWIAPLWQSQHGWGLDAGNMDYGFNGNLGGVSLGADYTFENAIRAGITFNIGGGYAESSGGDLSSTENRMNFWGLGAYAGWNYENFGVMADVSYTSTWNQLKQDLDSRLGMGNKLEADVQASAISAGLRAEYLLQTSAMDIIPHIGVRYMSLNTWGYDVDTHGGTVLEGDSLHQDIWTFPIGVTFTKDFALDSGWSFKPSLDFTVIPAAGDIKAKHDVHFTGLPGTYEVETQMMDYLTWQGGVGLELANDNMSIGVNYTLQAGQHTTGHGVFGSFRYEF
ncbi:autotransporter domain-containing protein [Desulfovibrio piger]|uniref:autotransporter domain-containing protein n=1 Tax=Desulfovibrio piger TaxID=901 RepID=UPI0026F0D84F|nr:autotransporter domain-containing protein [Desulfovibrio piger]